MLGTLISHVLLGGFTTAPYFCKISGLNWRKPYLDTIKIVFSNIPVMFFWLFFAKKIEVSSWFSLLIFAGFVSFTLYATVFFFFVKSREKQDIYTACELLGMTKAKLPRSILQWLLGVSCPHPLAYKQKK